MPLTKYQQKRNFQRTPEPSGRTTARPRARPIFVVQRHDASRLHYDLRLEIDGVLASWAVPKGPSLDPDHKRLAVHVEDHPIDYATFEGNIPRGEYGGGSVMLWDRGWWEPDGDPARALRSGKLTFTLHGERLRGRWTLTRIRADRAQPDSTSPHDNWLLLKHDDDEAKKNARMPLRSVSTDRTQDEIAQDVPAAVPAPAATTPQNPSKINGARRAALPLDPRPQLCTLAERAPEGPDWLHEIKYDGYRLLAWKDGQKIRLLTRSGHDWTHRFAPLAEAMRALPCESAVLDGEACITEPGGRTSFQRLQRALKEGSLEQLSYYAFDLLHLGDFDLMNAPLLARKEALRAMLEQEPGGPARSMSITFSEHVQGSGRRVQQSACDLALEGIVSKRADSLYTPHRSRTWLKIRCGRRQEFVVIGWTPPTGSRRHLGALLLGAYEQNSLIYAGRVGTGFSADTLKDLRQRLDRLRVDRCPADQPPPSEDQRNVTWVRPELVAEVAFTEWTDDGRLRHPSFQGLRSDKPAREVTVEETARAARTDTAAAASQPEPAGRADDNLIEGVRITNPQRILFPDVGLTKLELARYYASVADRMLPFLVGRPLSTVRCPTGQHGTCFFQKHLRETFSEPVRSIAVKESDGPAQYIAVDSAAGLVSLVQHGVIEIHPWGSAEPDLERPNVITIDLDPGPGVQWKLVRDGARRVREILAEAGLESFVKATGGKGLHVVAPLTPDLGWDETKAFCRSVAERMQREDPQHYISTASKAKRAGRVFVDYLRNGRGATSIAPFSVRARPGAPVAMPLRWSELGRVSSADRYTVQNVSRRLSQMRSPAWPSYVQVSQRIRGGAAKHPGAA